MERGALEFAESQFRRAVWLNPYEPSFRFHWALSLLKLERRPEAHDVLCEVLAKNPEDKETLELWRQNWPNERPTHQNAQREQAPAPPNAEAGP